jgi:murein L,D-transpeptidase YcbB/YkuD
MLDLELLLSDGLLRFAAHLISGRTRAGTFDPQLNDFRHELDLLPIIEQAAAGNPEQVLRHLEPSAPAYRQLMAALERHRTLEQQGGWPTVPPGPVLAVGDHAPELRLQALRSRLQASGDLEAGAPVAEGQYSVELADAVRRFQDNHGLTVDGKLGPTTNKELAVPAAERSNSIALTLERLRWLPRDLGQRYLRVDIAAATLALVENGRQVLDMRVIVGQARRPTAIFSDQVRYLVFYPYWEVPHTLAVEDELPKIQADPSWIEKRDFEVLRGWGDHARIVNPSSIDWASLDRHDFPYRLRQRPGRSNALGRIKFMFPNAFDIYLHDTPRRDLFERSDRRLSSGCVRLENPIELAAELLEGTPLWDRWRIDRVLAAGNQTTVSLLQPVPIHLVYFTAWPDEQGAIHFRRDIYGLDAGLSSDLGR